MNRSPEKYANDMTDDIIHSTQFYIKYINRAILINLQRRPLKLGRLIALIYRKHTYDYKNSVPVEPALLHSPLT